MKLQYVCVLIVTGFEEHLFFAAFFFAFFFFGGVSYQSSFIWGLGEEEKRCEKWKYR